MKKLFLAISLVSACFSCAAQPTGYFWSATFTSNYIYTNMRSFVAQYVYTNSDAGLNVTNLWSGPSNNIPLYQRNQYYDTVTPVSITGFVGKSNNVDQSVLLNLRNTGSTNIVLYLPTNVEDAYGTNNYTITTGGVFVLSMRYSPTGHTNSVGRKFTKQ